MSFSASHARRYCHWVCHCLSFRESEPVCVWWFDTNENVRYDCCIAARSPPSIMTSHVHLIHYWCYYCEPYSPNVSPVWVIFPFWKKKKKSMSVSPQHSLPSVSRLFLLSLEILQLPSQLRSWFQGTVCAVLPHLECLAMKRCMSEQRIKRTLSRSERNWNHFIMRHYGKCRASEGAINIVKPKAGGTQRLHVLFLGLRFIVV